MMNKLQVQVVAGVVLLVFAIGIIASGDTVKSDWLRFFAYAVTAAVLVLTAWNRWLWRTTVGQRFKQTPRDVSGTWKGTLTSQWVDPSTSQPAPTKTAYVVIRQTASSLSVTMLTDEMRSTSSLAAIGGEDGDISLDYIYMSSPRSSVEHRSRMHRGGTALEVTGASKPVRLHGRYWTDRDSRGELDFDRRVKDHAEDFQAAEALFP